MPIAAGVHSGIAKLHIAQNDFIRARQFALTGVNQQEKWANADSPLGCYLALANIDLETTKTHICRIESKLNAENRTQAISLA